MSLGSFPNMHLLDSTFALELLRLLAESSFHLSPYIDESALNDFELALPLCIQLLSLCPMLLLQRLVLLCLLRDEQLRPIDEFLLG